ncbi:class F sortase [Nocardioides marmoraquaticus]
MRGVVGLVGLLVLVGCGGSPEPTTAPERPVSTAAPASTEGQRLERKPCPTTAEPFEPTSATVPGVGRDLTVVAPPRASEHVPGTPPTDAVGKLQLAYDRDQGVQPGDRRGNVLLNAHTFPGGPEETALGNRLLAGLAEGGRVVLAGEGRSLCYRVTDRVEVDADQPFFRYYADDGRPQVAIVVCSGDRLDPGVWTKRTVWFARPSA